MRKRPGSLRCPQPLGGVSLLTVGGEAKKPTRWEPALPSCPDGRFAALYEQLPDWAVLDGHLLANLRAHGDYPAWQAAVDQLPACDAVRLSVGDVVALDGPLPAAAKVRLRTGLQALHPWRKGPFSLFGMEVDAEWRSDLKWRRVAPTVALAGCRVLDIGCGNGYFGWRMLAAGADLVVGLDAFALFHAQHEAINRYAQSRRNWVLPLRFEQLPPERSEARFDAVFSMGVLYHQRHPRRHLAQMRHCLRPGGQAVLESLVVDGRESLRPSGRYARMGNVRIVPTPSALAEWLAEAGFQDIRIHALSPTTTDEQRTTSWMRFQSLAEALDPTDPSRTVEGRQAPLRCVLTARNRG